MPLFKVLVEVSKTYEVEVEAVSILDVADKADEIEPHVIEEQSTLISFSSRAVQNSAIEVIQNG